MGDEFRMTPRELVDAPADQTDEEAQAVRDAFTLTLDTRKLPLAGRASTVNMSGGSIFFEAQRFNVSVAMSAYTLLLNLLVTDPPPVAHGVLQLADVRDAAGPCHEHRLLHR